MRRTAVIAPPIATFIIGLLISVTSDVFGKSYIVGSRDRFLLVAIVSILALLGGLFILYGLYHTQLREQASEIDSRLSAIEGRLNLSAEFIDDKTEDGGGMSYERTAQLIRDAKRSVRCVDFWVQPPAKFGEGVGGNLGGDADGDSTNPESLRRKKYYEAIEEKMRLFSRFGSSRDVFYKRIIQLEAGADLGVDYRYHTHLLGCLDADKGGPNAAAVRVAKAQIQMNFTIIDDRYVVWPIMTTNLITKNVERIGAIMFNDPGQQLVNCLRSLFARLDNSADALSRRHLTPGGAE
jgi:hypothetical protein